MSTNTILVFDVDGTLTAARQKITPEMLEFLVETRKTMPLAVVGGSDFNKITEQLADDKDHLLSLFDYIFSENGLVGFKGTDPFPSQSIQKAIGDEKLQELINFALRYMSDIRLPVKRGNFVEFRNGMINLSPIGRSCSQAERDQFVVFDRENGVRAKFVDALKENFSKYGLEFAIGGQISVDVFPTGWDKTFCLQYIEKDYDVIHFFGDKTAPGGNDHEIFADSRTIGHTVNGPEDTKRQIEKILGKQYERKPCRLRRKLSDQSPNLISNNSSPLIRSVLFSRLVFSPIMVPIEPSDATYFAQLLSMLHEIIVLSREAPCVT
ncbi:unnamed protein product [Caenorhabditis sp. 36 PRJEB53466]|nr:unnamed protein product [Caenorhabditis sp. 36 PRJEB53466]